MGRSKSARPAPKPSQPPQLQKLLANVAQYYRRLFGVEARAREYLAERGITDKEALEVFGAGYCDGTLHDVLPFDDQVHDELQRLGVIKPNNKELMRECVTFALHDFNGACAGMYGRRLFDSDVQHLYLPGPRRGLVNWQAAKRAADDGSEVFLTESILDALSLYVAGIRNAVPCYGAGGFTQDHVAMLQRFGVQRVAISFDGDALGQRAAKELAAKLTEGASPKPAVRIVTLPDGNDPNSLLVTAGPDALRQAVIEAEAAPPPFAAVPATTTHAEATTPNAGATSPTSASTTTATNTNTPHTEATPSGFILQIQHRHYEAKAIARQGTQLRVTLKASNPTTTDNRFELSTIDLYSHRSREWFAGLCAAFFAIDYDIADADMRAIVEHAEEVTGSNTKPKELRIELTDTERADAMALLQKPDLIEQLLADYESVGYTGEVINKQVGYLVGVSRLLDKPLSLLIESRSSAGKSALQDAILGFVPKEGFLKYSRITDQALFYQGEDALAHKLLVIEEAAGMGGAVYSVRALQSGEEIRVAATGKDALTGQMKAHEYTVKAKTSVMMTTTNPDFDEETKSRFMQTTVDESEAMTRAIMEVQRHGRTAEGIALRRRAERIKALHHNAQRLLQKQTVANPYSDHLTFPTHSIFARRDNMKYLGLIEASALLHQHQRDRRSVTHYGETVEHIVATLDDIALANRIAKEILIKPKGQASPQGVKLFKEIRGMLVNGSGAKGGEKHFNRRRLREHTGWSDWQVRTHLQELVELEYLHVRQGKFGKEYVYELSDTYLLESLPGFGLTDVDALGAALTSPQSSYDKGGGPSTSRPRRQTLSEESGSYRNLEGP